MFFSLRALGDAANVTKDIHIVICYGSWAWYQQVNDSTR